jgi:hypothetical protein
LDFGRNFKKTKKALPPEAGPFLQKYCLKPHFLCVFIAFCAISGTQSAPQAKQCQRIALKNNLVLTKLSSTSKGKRLLQENAARQAKPEERPAPMSIYYNLNILGGTLR